MILFGAENKSSRCSTATSFPPTPSFNQKRKNLVIMSRSVYSMCRRRKSTEEILAKKYPGRLEGAAFGYCATRSQTV